MIKLGLRCFSIFQTLFNRSQSSVAFYIGISQLIYTPNQITGFYLKCSAGFKWVKEDLDSIKTLVLLELLFVWFSLKFTLSFKTFVHKNKGIEVPSKTRKEILLAVREEKHLY